MITQTSSEKNKTTPIVIDCDPGIDDALALLLAAGSPELQLLAVTTVAGNRPVQTTSRNARQILDQAGKVDVPVYAGAARPFAGVQARCNLVHGEDGLGGVQLVVPRAVQEGHAVTRLVELLTQHDADTVTVIAIGPLTNLALAEMLAPGILRRAQRLLIMGGALRVPGNITPAAEFNFYADPQAAEIVMASQADIVLFPLDVTGKAIMSAQWIASFALLGTRCGTAATAMLQAYAAQDPLLHDACPVAWLLNPDLFSVEEAEIAVDCRPGLTEGQVLAHFHARESMPVVPNVSAATSVDNPNLLALIAGKIAGLP